jgi:hypothetical protein
MLFGKERSSDSWCLFSATVLSTWFNARVRRRQRVTDGEPGQRPPAAVAAQTASASEQTAAPVQMWAAASPSPGADVAAASPSPGADVGIGGPQQEPERWHGMASEPQETAAAVLYAERHSGEGLRSGGRTRVNARSSIASEGRSDASNCTSIFAASPFCCSSACACTHAYACMHACVRVRMYACVSLGCECQGLNRP